jgi:hypothetical protein
MECSKVDYNDNLERINARSSNKVGCSLGVATAGCCRVLAAGRGGGAAACIACDSPLYEGLSA